MAERWADAVETHTAALFFAGNRVYKVKKPVRLDFLDWTDHDVRRHVCERELTLNRRLAPDVYLGVATIGLDAEPPEPAVVMRRMPSASSLAARVEANDELLSAWVVQIADLLASFHAQCGVVGRDLGGGLWSSPSELWRTEIARIRALRWPGIDDELLRRLGELAETYACGRAQLFAQRLADGHVRDGHGDLLASDIYLLPDGPRVLDCLEFDDRLRVCDVLHDVAFLAMDLEQLGRWDLAGTLLERYCATSGERHPATLAEFFIAHRALVRSKVHAIRAQQRDDPTDGAASALLDLCRRHLERAQVRVVLVGGLPGSGKTTLAEALAEELPARWLSSDQIRQEIAAATTAGCAGKFERGRYAPGVTARVYRELLRRAREAALTGEHVVIDASWRAAGSRALARELAAEAGAVCVELLVEIDDCTASKRLAERVPAPGGSEATLPIRRRMQSEFEAWPQATAIATDVCLDDSVDAALVAIRNRRRERST